MSPKKVREVGDPFLLFVGGRAVGAVGENALAALIESHAGPTQAANESLQAV